jgi:Uma2 family endonuclease
VVCGEPKFEDGYLDTLLNPTLLIEILSKSTERYDRIAKSDYYRRLESLAEHLLVAQEEVRVEQYSRQPDGHRILVETSSLDGVVDLQSINCSLPLVDVYKKVVLG